MDTKKLIKDKLDEGFNPYKRASMVKSIMDKCMNHLFDAYRELDMALQYCDNPDTREKLELVRRQLGKDNGIAGYLDSDNSSIITDLQSLSDDLKP